MIFCTQESLEEQQCFAAVCSSTMLGLTIRENSSSDSLPWLCSWLMLKQEDPCDISKSAEDE